MNSKNKDKESNLFKLHKSTDVHPRSWICIKGKGIKEVVSNIETDIVKNQGHTREEISRQLSKNLGCYHTSFKRILRRESEYFSIPFINELIKLSKKDDYFSEIHSKIEFLKVNSASSKKVLAANILNKDLAKVLGAFMADGSLSRCNGHHSLEISDGHRSNLEAFKRWILQSFNVQPTSFKRISGAWRLVYTNKVIARYLIKFFDVIPGPKSRVAFEPKIIKESTFEIRKLFARGVLMFDGSFTTSGKLAFSTKSRILFDAIKDILNKDSIAIGTAMNRGDFILYSCECASKEKILYYFEEGTVKWQKVKDFLETKNQNIGDLIKRYKVYPNNKVTFEKLYNLIENVKACDLDYLSNQYNCSRHIIKSYLIILRNSGLIKFSRRPHKINERFINNSIQIFMKKDIHDLIFMKIKKMFGTYKNLSNQMNIHKATISTWKLRKNRIRLSILKNICNLCNMDFSIVLRNVEETDRNIIEFIR